MHFFANIPFTAGTSNVTMSVNDGNGGSDSVSFSWTIDPAPVAPSPQLRAGTISNVGSSWQTVTLDRSYNDMVVVATAQYPAGSLPAVVRVRNAGGNSFEVRVQNPSGSSLSNYTVHYIVAEHGVKMEAVKFTSTATDRKNSWNGQARSYLNSYSNPVVLGQVMMTNDVNWSTFWARGSSTNSPPNGSSLFGKHVGEDPSNSRANEMIGYIVIESGSSSIDGTIYEAGVGTDIVRGHNNAPPYAYNLAGTHTGTILAPAAVDGLDGAWPVVTSVGSQINLFVDEDQLRDSERAHTTEQIAYFATSSN